MCDPGAGGYLVVLTVHQVVSGGDTGNGEFVMDQRRVEDNKLVHVGVAILQISKLMFLEFVSFLRDFLVPGSYQTVYCDTDSLVLATSKT